MPILERYLSSSDIPGVADTITGVSTVLPVNVITILINKTITSSGTYVLIIITTI